MSSTNSISGVTEVFEAVEQMMQMGQEQDQDQPGKVVQSRRERRLNKRKHKSESKNSKDLSVDHAKFLTPPTLLPPPDVDDDEVEAELNKYQEAENEKLRNKKLEEVRAFNEQMKREAAALLLLPSEDRPLTPEQMRKLCTYKDWGHKFVQAATAILCAVYLLFPNK